MSRAALFVVIQFVLFAVYGALYLVLPMSGSLTVIGTLCVLVAVALFGFSILDHLRRNAAPPNITPTPQRNAELVETGMYRWIRHPIYSAVLLGALGLGIIHGHPVVVSMTVVFLVFFSLKARYEESMLRQVYPRYGEYMRRTGRFIPGINFI